MKKRNYRPLPFWSWNEKLNTEETVRQVRLMHKAGLGGFFMHARGGLTTEYLGEEWFENIDAATAEAEALGMEAWAYDENGWPSGAGNGIVPDMGVAFQQKYLVFEENGDERPETLFKDENCHIYFVANPLYADTLSGDAMQFFLDNVYEKYADKKKIRGFFTDEPQAVRGKIVWSVEMEHTYRELYGEELRPLLPSLFRPVGDYKTIRFRFWKMVTYLFDKNYMQRIYNWCQAHGMQLTGHLMLEGSLLDQLPVNGASMPHYAHFHIPGIDWLGYGLTDAQTALQLTSVGHQLGKKQLLTETYAGSGHNIDFEHMKGMLAVQSVRGITLLCQHLEGYSMRGIRKRDFPPALFYQQPWWKYYKTFNDHASAVGAFLGEGKIEYDTLLLHPQATAWTLYDGTENPEIKAYSSAFSELLRTLEKKHILFHLGDETLMEKYGRVEGNTLHIGTQKYTRVLLPLGHDMLFDSTRALLDAFLAGGGEILNANDIAANPIIEGDDILYTKRRFGDTTIYYFVNRTKEYRTATLHINGEKLDILTNEKTPFCGKNYKFAPFEEVFVVEGEATKPAPDLQTEKADLGGTWKIENNTPNFMTLDTCDFTLDEVIEKNMYVPDIMTRLYGSSGPHDVRLLFRVKMEYLPESLYLLCETPEIYEIFVNGSKVTNPPDGWSVDISFQKIDITAYCQKGENNIELRTVFRQSEEACRDQLEAHKCETIKNKLTYEMEIEPCYLMGNFSIETPGNFENIDWEIGSYDGEFIISAPKTEITLSHLERQGFPFFAGEIVVSKKIYGNGAPVIVDLQKEGWNVIEILLDNISKGIFLWAPYHADLGYLKGEHTLSLRLCTNLHNLLGPHHCKVYRKWGLSPGVFFKELCLWNRGVIRPFTPEYCFAYRSIKSK